MTLPAASLLFMQAVSDAASPTQHPYGGLEFRRRGETACFASLVATDRITVEISGMYAPLRGGGRHAMSLLCLLADLYGVTLSLVAASSVPSRMDTDKVAAWYRRFGFEGDSRDTFGGVQMVRTAQALPFTAVRGAA